MTTTMKLFLSPEITQLKTGGTFSDTEKDPLDNILFARRRYYGPIDR